MTDKVYVGSRVGSLEIGQPYEPISRVTFHVDDDHYYTAGDDTGRTIERDMPWATQEMVDDVYQQLKGFVYKPFKATDAMIDPAAELGDGVTVGGEYFMLAQMDTVFDAKCASTIGAPGGGEMDHEFPYVDPVERELKRRVKLGQNYYGTKITRREGLVIERTDGETVTARVVLNADEMSFYDGNGNRVLFFDPTTGTYKFTGVLNVSDKFVVDKFGNVKMSGNLNLDAGTIYWGDTPPNKKRYAASIDGPWHDTMQSGDLYCCDWDYTVNDWKAPYKFKGEDGANGVNGSDGDPAAYLKSIKITEIGPTSMRSALIQGARIEGAEIWGAEITGGKIKSETEIDVTTNAKVGGKLTVNADNFGNGVDFRHADGSLVAEVYVDPQSQCLFLSAPHGKVLINGEEWSPVARFG